MTGKKTVFIKILMKKAEGKPNTFCREMQKANQKKKIHAGAQTAGCKRKEVQHSKGK